MTPEELIKLYPQFEKIGFSSYINIIRSEFDPNKTWGEMGLDDFDMIELIMRLEKEFDFSLSDLHFDELFGLDKKPFDFILYNRDKIIDKILNE